MVLPAARLLMIVCKCTYTYYVCVSVSVCVCVCVCVNDMKNGVPLTLLHNTNLTIQRIRFFSYG